ncbi:MAG: 2,4-dihydroxyhept-2-ene-1,7-dioic acid aldolase [Actinobacteria bacterium]|nr:2,4-dihydroxyhept-2-ene-1,7-dioic acid aldolase [Actinomycetota bacterium]MCG2797905.1 aldolase/citrate lyase family protein [Cellulomonas sp.]
MRADAAALRALWAADTPAFGAWSTLADPVVAELLAAGPADYVCVDTQHGHVTGADLARTLQAFRAGGRAPVVRVAWNEPAAIFRALDAGASGVVVPMVDDGDAARAAVRAVRYPPAGERSWGPMWGDSRPVPAPADQDREALCVVMVETAAAVDHLDEILATAGVDAVYIGPNDLALSCGLGRATYRDCADVRALLDGIVATCRRRGVPVGLHCSDAVMAGHWAAEGVRMLTAVTETAALRRAVADELEGAAAHYRGAVPRTTGR